MSLIQNLFRLSRPQFEVNHCHPKLITDQRIRHESIDEIGIYGVDNYK